MGVHGLPDHGKRALIAFVDSRSLRYTIVMTVSAVISRTPIVPFSISLSSFRKNH